MNNSTWAYQGYGEANMHTLMQITRRRRRLNKGFKVMRRPQRSALGKAKTGSKVARPRSVLGRAFFGALARGAAER